MKYKRVLLKLSGEALMGSRQYGIDNDRLVEYAKEIKKVVDAGVELAIVIGGGNIFRGVAGAAKDHLGLLIFGLLLSIVMMATMANLISKWVKSYPWLAWLGLLAILWVAADLIVTDIKDLLSL